MTTKNQDNDPATLLQQLGFTEYEARAYIVLVKQGGLNGYQLAKHSGIPRANIYAVAGKLLERGAVTRSQGSRGQLYQAVAPGALLRSIRAGQQRALKAADRAFAHMDEAREPAMVFNLRGGELLVRARQLIDACQSSLSLAIQQPEAAALADALQGAHARGVAITTLCLEACQTPCGGCQGQLHRFQLAPRDGSRWLVMAVDTEQALVGRFSGPDVEGLVTGQHLVIELVDAYIRQSLTLATLGDELAGRFQGLLSEQAQQLLETLHSEGIAPSSMVD